ncbi:MAG: hypothetical protein KGZ40_00045 [Clostridiales bacterium]|nr:hypothetical protein [Clostridiales bacterium]
MTPRRPDISDEDLGMRAFQLRKAQATERAIDRVRHGLGAEWTSLTGEEIAQIEWVLGELWAYAARADWDDLHFGSLRMHDMRRILVFGRELRTHSRSAVDVLQDVAQIVRNRS